MASAENGGVTIIKRRRGGGEEAHHGGAWKVAYADFVTAMMAFFLLMWLLNATSEEQRHGLAEYFDPKVPISRISGGGSGVLSGDSLFAEDTLAQSGVGGEKERPSEENQAKGDLSVEGVEKAAREAGGSDGIEDVETLFNRMSGETDEDYALLRHIRMRVTDEGLVVELFDLADAPLFERGSAVPSPQMRALLAMVGQVAGMVTNRIAVEGHTDAAPFAGEGYGNWELSSDRAHVARRALTEAGVAPKRMVRVTGKADRQPALPDDPLNPRNRRIAVTFLRNPPG